VAKSKIAAVFAVQPEEGVREMDPRKHSVLSVACSVGLAAGTLLAIPTSASANTIAEFPLPTANSSPNGIAAGPDGSLWFTEFSDRIGRITTAGVITEFPLAGGSGPVGIAAGPDGNLWFTEAEGSNIGRITTAGAITEFAVTAGPPGGITAGPDGNLWFTEFFDTIGRITTAGVVTVFPLRAGSEPADIAAGADGNLWFTEGEGNSIGRITTTGVITEFPLFSGSQPSGIAAGADGNLWFTEVVGNNIGRITTAGVVSEFPLPKASSFPLRIAAGPRQPLVHRGQQHRADHDHRRDHRVSTADRLERALGHHRRSRRQRLVHRGS